MSEQKLNQYVEETLDSMNISIHNVLFYFSSLENHPSFPGFVSFVFDFFTVKVHQSILKWITKRIHLIKYIDNTLDDFFFEDCKNFKCANSIQKIQNQEFKKFLLDTSRDFIKQLSSQLPTFKVNEDFHAKVFISVCYSVSLFIKIKIHYPVPRIDKIKTQSDFDIKKHYSVNEKINVPLKNLYPYKIGLRDYVNEISLKKSEVATVGKTDKLLVLEKQKHYSLPKKPKSNSQNLIDYDSPKPQDIDEKMQVSYDKKIESPPKPQDIDEKMQVSYDKRIQSPPKIEIDSNVLDIYVPEKNYVENYGEYSKVFESLDKLVVYIDNFFENLKSKIIGGDDSIDLIREKTISLTTERFGLIVDQVDMNEEKLENILHYNLDDQLFNDFKQNGKKAIKGVKNPQLIQFFAHVKKQITKQIESANHQVKNKIKYLIDFIVFYSIFLYKSIRELDNRQCDIKFILGKHYQNYQNHLHCAKDRIVQIVKYTIDPGIINLTNNEILLKSNVVLYDKHSTDMIEKCHDDDVRLPVETDDLTYNQTLIDMGDTQQIKSNFNHVRISLSQLVHSIQLLMKILIQKLKLKQTEIDKVRNMLLKLLIEFIQQITNKQQIKSLNSKKTNKLISPFLNIPMEDGGFLTLIKFENSYKETPIFEAFQLINKYIYKFLKNSIKKNIKHNQLIRHIQLISMISVLLYFKLQNSIPRMHIMVHSEGEEFKPIYSKSSDEKTQVIKKLICPGIKNSATGQVLLKSEVELLN